MHLRNSLWSGFLMGFLFGTVGLWMLALLSVVLQPVEVISQPLFAFGKWAGGLMMSNGTVTTPQVLLLFLGNGLLYGVIGVVIQMLVRMVRGK